jgi:hypothetical protein
MNRKGLGSEKVRIIMEMAQRIENQYFVIAESEEKIISLFRFRSKVTLICYLHTLINEE